ncbi:DSBA-like thioredoxin domain protein [Asticcacaulis biprosthecium C19]|uniref:DSBA-like thioredoxin domain protein n=1 Tax=Asticcacaulis biprosthecium C19 TaxID=715226 RepID=F4QQA2_9CAUL|nr:thioredoxin domain-containing protein [Asticcacaulis biprosthecium]EGF90389.1 DSBA-like thioredoxin domain protein [Asticcacaulis biprosthecium C19]
MSEPELPKTENVSPKPATKWTDNLQAHITTGLAVFAVILAAAPYLAPKVAAWQTQKGLMEQPAMLRDASEKLQLQANEAMDAKTREILKARADSLKPALYGNKMDPILGNPAGAIKIVEFLDYKCGACRAGSPHLKAFLEQNPDVALIVKEYPIISKNSRPLAAYALAASEAGKYEAVHYALMTNQVESQEDVHALLAAAGLDPKAIQTRMESDEIQNYVVQTVMLGQDLEINATPTFIVDGEPISGTDIPALTAAVEKLRKKNKA